MKSDVYQWFKFNPIHWQMGKVQRCSFECQSEFINLCCLWWSKKGDVSVSDAEDRYDFLEEMIKRKIIKIEDQMILIDFLKDQLDEINELSRKNSERGRLGGLKKKKTTENEDDNEVKRPLSDRLATANQKESDRLANGKQKRREEKREEEKSKSISSDDDGDFEVFWDTYGKKTGRKKSEAKWKKLKHEDKEEILSTVADYVQSKKDPKYRPNPLTYLNGELWKDEIIMPEPTEYELRQLEAETTRSLLKDCRVSSEYIDSQWFEQHIYHQHIRECMKDGTIPEAGAPYWEKWLSKQTRPLEELIEEFKNSEHYEHALRINAPSN